MEQTYSTAPTTAWQALQSLKVIQQMQTEPWKQKSPANSPSSKNSTPEEDKTDRARKLKEQLNCRICKGLSQCQYKAIGNQGFEPIWEEWNRRYEVVKECTYKKAERARLRTARLFGVSGIPYEYRQLRLKDLEKNTATNTLLDLLLGEVQHIYLKGASGSGKTRYVSALGNELIAQGEEVLYLTSKELVTQLRYQNEDYYLRLKELSEASTVILEDLGEERHWEYNEEQLELIIDRRIREGKKLIVTSENTIEELSGKYIGKGIIKRLNRMRVTDLSQK